MEIRRLGLYLRVRVKEPKWALKSLGDPCRPRPRETPDTAWAGSFNRNSLPLLPLSKENPDLYEVYSLTFMDYCCAEIDTYTLYRWVCARARGAKSVCGQPLQRERGYIERAVNVMAGRRIYEYSEVNRSWPGVWACQTDNGEGSVVMCVM